MKSHFELSPAAYERLKAEYDDLTTRGRVEIARKIEAARELGDLSENGDYHAAKEEQGKMEGRIMHLNAILENHVIVDPSDSDEVLLLKVLGMTILVAGVAQQLQVSAAVGAVNAAM